MQNKCKTPIFFFFTSFTFFVLQAFGKAFFKKLLYCGLILFLQAFFKKLILIKLFLKVYILKECHCISIPKMTDQTPSTFSLLYSIVEELKQANSHGQLEQCNTLLGEVQDFIDEHGDELRNGPDFPVLKRALEMRVLIWPARDIVALLEGNYESINRNRSLTITRDTANDSRYVFTLNRTPQTSRPTDGDTQTRGAGPRSRSTYQGRGNYQNGNFTQNGPRGGFQGRGNYQGRGGFRGGQNTSGQFSASGAQSVYVPQKAWADQ